MSADTPSVTSSAGSSTRSSVVLRALLRGLLRLSLRPIFGPSVPVRMQRRILALSQALTHTTRGVAVTPARWGAVPGETLTPARVEAADVVLYLHGGGYCVGSPASHRPLTSALAARSGRVVHVPDYRLAPEHRYPAALEDALAAYRELAGEPARAVTIAGDSAGGGLALKLAIAARDAGLPAPAALLLISPWVDLACDSDSMATAARRDPMLTRDTLRRWAREYARDMPADDPRGSPLHADLRRLPPMLIQVGTDEILHDDATRLAARAQAAGVEVTLQPQPGLWHDFHLHVGLLPEAGAAIDSLAAFLRAHAPSPRAPA